MSQRATLGWRALAAVALVVTGFAGGIAYQTHGERQVVHTERVGTAQILDDLQLTRQQRARIDSVLARYQVRSDSIVAFAFPALRAIADSLQFEIDRQLTPEQRERLKAVVARQRAGDVQLGPGPGF